LKKKSKKLKKSKVVCVVEKSNKKNYQTKTGKKFNSKQKLKKILIPFFLR